MNRRDAVIGLTALGALPLAGASWAQQAAKPARIAYLGFGSPQSAGYLVDAFKQGLRDLGYIEGRNFVFEARWALGKAERLPDLAKELVALKPDVILAGSPTQVRAAQQATTTIPIVMTYIADPIGSGFANSLARPGGNITGLANIAEDLSPKMLELLLKVMPKVPRVAALWNPSNPAHTSIQKNLQEAAQRLGVDVLSLGAQTSVEIENAFVRMGREHLRAVIIHADPLFLLQRTHIAELASKNKLSSVCQTWEYVNAGNLMSYGVNFADGYRRAATYVDKILKGAKPGDLPIEQPTTFELVINMKTAKALGLAIPQSVLLSADRVIE